MFSLNKILIDANINRRSRLRSGGTVHLSLIISWHSRSLQLYTVTASRDTQNLIKKPGIGIYIIATQKNLFSPLKLLKFFPVFFTVFCLY